MASCGIDGFIFRNIMFYASAVIDQNSVLKVEKVGKVNDQLFGENSPLADFICVFLSLHTNAPLCF